jgi:phenylacetate-CoA ligase
MRWLDTPESWDWFKKLWGTIYRAAGVRPGHRLMFPFTFGPFVGFWAAFDGATALGNLALAAGGMSTAARLRMLVENHVDVVCCTPTYALRMAEVAEQEHVDLAAAKVSKLIVAGEPGGSVPEIRARIERTWNARVYDHTGMTEIGAAAFECHESPGTGVHVNEGEYIPEVIDPQTGRAVPDGEPGELVITNLGRWGSPLIRYRTNDRVRLTRAGPCACGRSYARLEGGILGRYDDMITVRGNNLFPAGIEAVIRKFPEVAEFRVTVAGAGALAEVEIELEPATEAAAQHLADRVARAVQNALSFRAQVRTVPCGSLPRFEMKAKRFIRRTS